MDDFVGKKSIDDLIKQAKIKEAGPAVDAVPGAGVGAIDATMQGQSSQPAVSGATTGGIANMTNIINSLYQQNPEFKSRYDALLQTYQTGVSDLVSQFSQQAMALGNQSQLAGATTGTLALGTPGAAQTV